MSFPEAFEPPVPVAASPGRVPWGLADVALALGVLIIAAIFIIVPALVAAAIIADDPDHLMDDPEALAILLGANLVLEAALIGVALIFSVGKYRCRLGDLGFRLPQKGGLWLPIAVLFAAYFIVSVYFGIVTVIDWEPLEPESTVPEAVFDSPVALPIAAVLALLFAPLMEEAFFRGFVFGSLRSRWGLLSGALASGLLFAALHFDVGTLVPFTLIGVLFALAYAYSGSLFAAVVAHFLFNAVSFLVSLGGGT